METVIDIETSALGITGIEADPENAGGWVGRIDRMRLASARAVLANLGYAVSDSQDDAGVTWIWWGR